MLSTISNNPVEFILFFGQTRDSAPARSLGDDELVRAVLQRDRKATAEFVQLFSGRVYSYVRSRLTPRVEPVDDLVHETFLAAWQRLSSFRGDSDLDAWILGIARHKVEDHYRDRLARMDVWDEELERDAELSGDEHAIDVELDRRLVAQRASNVLAGLPEHYATILRWRYWEQRNCRAIGMSIGKTEKAVERVLARARAHFKNRWIND
jgi:RNA polymerase sigma-70 factor (ECF subfamily)